MNLEWEVFEFETECERHAGCDLCHQMFVDLEHLISMGAWTKTATLAGTIRDHLYPEGDEEFGCDDPDCIHDGGCIPE